MNLSFIRSRRLRYLLGLTGLSWGLFVFFRIIFYFAFSSTVDVTQSEIIRAFWMGVRFDLRLSILFSLPLLILSIVPLVNMGRSSQTRLIGKWIYGILIGGAILFYTADFGHYAYLQQRVDITALSLLENPVISFQLVWESYPVVFMIIMLGILLATWIKIHNIIMGMTVEKQSKYFDTSHKITGLILGGLIYFFSIWGTFAQYALFWSDAFFSRDPFVSGLALNPILYFYDTTTFSEADYNEEKVREYYPLISDWLGVDNPDGENLNFLRHIRGDKTDGPPPNIIIIFMESVGLNRMGIMGNPLNPTPYLDRLAGSGLFFNKFYVPWVSTSRSLFTMFTGIPDVARIKTSSRNPLIRDQYSIISQFENYDKYFLMGGSASWANIRSLLTYNLKDLKISELGNYERQRVDVWGISDLDLFREANGLFSNRDDEKPFFAVVQTAGNHKPYTIPDDNDGFEYKEMNNDELNKAGFSSVEQYNAMRLLDHTIGRFIKMTENSNYYNNTIFVLFGDHGNADPKAEHMAPDDYALRLRSYNVPLIIFAPGLDNQPQMVETVCGLADLMPTVAGLISIEYVNKTLGRDILKSENNFAFIVNKKISPGSYGVLNKDFYMRIFRNGSGMEFHNLRSNNPAADVQNGYPEEIDLFNKMSKGIYETAKYMLYHNKN